MDADKSILGDVGVTAQPPPYTPSNHQQEMPMPQPGGGYEHPQQVTIVTQTTKTSYSTMQSSIPIMPMWCAVTLCFVNWLLPGFGTIIASFTIFCCAVVEDPKQSKGSVFCMNMGVGWLQFFTCWVFLIGWVWSIIWGYAFITYSARYEERQRILTTTTVTRSDHVAVTIPPPITGDVTQDTSCHNSGQKNPNFE